MSEEAGGEARREKGGIEAEARRTPYELVFGPEEFEAVTFPRIQREAEDRGVDAKLREAFAFLSTAGEATRKVTPTDAPPEALEQYNALLHQNFNFWAYGKRVYLLDTAVARYLVEAAPSLEGWDLTLPHPSLYLQLPSNLFWGSIAAGSKPEPIDGFFVTAAASVDPLGKPFQRLQILSVLGIRRDRAGFSVIPFDTETGPGIAAVWAESTSRDDGSDFANLLPGGELSGLYSIVTAGEVLKLIARALWQIHSAPAGVVLEKAADRASADRPGSPPPPRLPYFRVCFDSEGGPAS